MNHENTIPTNRRPARPGALNPETRVNVLILFVCWCILLALSWPLALLVLVVLPGVWLVALPFRLAGLCVHAAFALVRALLFLPARLLGGCPGRG